MKAKQKSLEAELQHLQRLIYLKLHKSNLYPTFQREPSLSRELDMGKETNQIRTQDMTVLEWEFICPPTLKVLTQSFHLSTSK